MEITICDHRTTKGEPCGNRAEVRASLRWVDKNWVIDLCDVHSKELTAHAREAAAPANLPEQVTKLPRAEPKGTRKSSEQLVDKIDYPDLRAWLEAEGDLPAGSRGRIKSELQQKWIDAGEPRPI